MSTLRISNIEAKSVPASATIDEKVKITNSSGDTLVFLDGKTSGITTVGINTTDGNITFDANSNVVVTGIITATRFSGQITPTSLEIGSNIKLGNAGVITATSFVGSGANLTSIPAGNLTGTVADARISTLTASKLTGALPAISGANLTGITGTTINSNADNRVITGSGTANTLEGESTLTYANPTLEINTDSSYGTLKLDGDAGGLIEFKDDGTRKWELYGAANFSFYDRANTKYALKLIPGGNVEVSDGNLVIGTAGHGIDFSATSDASGSSSELLDDYEEGSYSPTLTGSGGGSFGLNPHALRYTKVGRVVHVSGRLYIHSSSGLSGSEVRMTLPYANSSAISSQDAHSYSHVTTYNAYNPNSDYQMVFSVLPGNSYGIFLWVVPNAAWQSVSPTSHMNQNAAYYGFDFSYTTAT